jgi:hypothetical protein
METSRIVSAGLFDWSSMMPARHISTRHNHLSGRVASAKVSKPQAFESMLEQDFLLLLEFDAAVSRYASQPITLRWHDGSRKRQYTPDVLVEYMSYIVERNPHLKPTLFEVKPEATLKQDWGQLKPKFKAAIRWCREYDCRFRLVTERYIRTPYLNNVKFLRQFGSDRFRHADTDTNGRACAMLRSTLFALGRTTPQELLEVVASGTDRRSELLPYLWYLVVCRCVGVDLQLPLTMHSPIWSLETGTNLAMQLGGENRSRILKILDQYDVDVAEGLW